MKGAACKRCCLLCMVLPVSCHHAHALVSFHVVRHRCSSGIVILPLYAGSSVFLFLGWWDRIIKQFQNALLLQSRPSFQQRSYPNLKTKCEQEDTSNLKNKEQNHFEYRVKSLGTKICNFVERRLPYHYSTLKNHSRNKCHEK